MIIRKPYAFLIRHFRKIHILLFVLCGFIYYKNLQLTSFVNEFINLGTYDAYTEPVTKYVSVFAVISLLVLIIGSLILAILLHHKQKPWKLYLLPIVEYTLTLMVYIAISNFFLNYTGELHTATIRAIRDFLFIATIFQYPTIGVFLFRILGVDLNKFNFKMDEEYLELSNEDREELEINIEFDKESLKRGTKRLIRNIGYVYQEHKRTITSLIILALIVVLFGSYRYLFVTHKTYRQGDTLNVNGYSITINNSYYTDKDYTGRIISPKSSFIILNLTMKNNVDKRVVDLNKFHIMNGINDYITTAKTFGTEFEDFGEAYEKIELRKDATINFILIFKVDKKLPVNRFVLYYQNFNRNNSLPTKIKLKLNDVSKIKENKTLTLGDTLKFNIKNQEEEVIFDEYEITDSINYSYRVCTSSTCQTHTDNYTAKPGYKILKITFASTNFEGKDMIDFSNKYGKINYKDNENAEATLEINSPLSRVYYGKYLYIKVPEQIEKSTSIELEYTIRNNKYIYKLR